MFRIKNTEVIRSFRVSAFAPLDEIYFLDFAQKRKNNGLIDDVPRRNCFEFINILDSTGEGNY